MTLFERSLSKLSENQKIVDIAFTEFKLRQLKEAANHSIVVFYLNGGGEVVQHISTAITLVPLVQFQKIYDFLKAYKDTFQMMCFNQKFRRALDHGLLLSMVWPNWQIVLLLKYEH